MSQLLFELNPFESRKAKAVLFQWPWVTFEWGGSRRGLTDTSMLRKEDERVTGSHGVARTAKDHPFHCQYHFQYHFTPQSFNKQTYCNLYNWLVGFWRSEKWRRTKNVCLVELFWRQYWWRGFLREGFRKPSPLGTFSERKTGLCGKSFQSYYWHAKMILRC